MNIISLNCCGAATTTNLPNGKPKVQIIFQWMPPNTDVVCLQETHLTASAFSKLLFFAKEKWYCFDSPGSSASRGVALFVNKSSCVKPPEKLWVDTEGRLVIVKVSTLHGDFAIGSSYAPATVEDRTPWFDSLCLPTSVPLIIGGDWNVVCAPFEVNRAFNAAKVPHSFFSFCARHNLKYEVPSDTPHTFHSRGSNYSAILDRVVAPEHIHDRAHVKVLPFPYSDHDAISYQWQPNEKAKPIWKLNPRLLDKEMCDYIKELWDELWELPERTLDPHRWWDDVKQEIRQLLIGRGVYITRKQQAEIREAKLDRAIEAELLKNDPNHNRKGFVEANARLKHLLDKRAEFCSGNMLRKLDGAGSRVTTAFLKAHKKRCKPQIITALHDPNTGVRETSSHKIVDIAERFYTTLFSRKETCPQSQEELLSSISTKLPHKARKALDAPLSLKELKKTCKTFCKGKAPGIDGLSTELYQKCPFLLKGVLVMWEQSLQCKHLSPSASMGLLKVLHKKAETDLITNYRPLTLGNSDYKLIAKAFAKRLASFVALVVPSAQTGFIPKRDIRGNVVEAHLTLKRLSRGDKEGAAVLLDFEKAYDRVDREYLFLVLAALGFGAAFILAMTILHACSTIVVCINNMLSNIIKVVSGVRQGCPIAPLLFAIATAPFLMLLHLSTKFSGVTTAKCNLRASMYADDTTLYISANELDKALSVIEVYERASGAKLNIAKCSFIPTSSNYHTKCDPMELIPIGKTDRLLGVQIGANTNMTEQWPTTCLGVTKTCEQWKSSKYPLLVKASASKIFIHSKIQYLANFSLPPKPQEKALKKDIWGVLFGKQTTSRVAYDVCTAPIAYGGLNAFDPITRIHATLASWIPRVEDPEAKDTHWATLFTNEQQHLASTINKHTLSSWPLNKKLLGNGVVGAAYFFYNKAQDIAKSHPLPPPPSSNNSGSDSSDEPLSVKHKKPSPKKQVSTLYRLLSGPHKVARILHHTLDDKDAQFRWKWIASMPANGKIHDMRWRNWHGKLLVERTPTGSPTSCPWCKEHNTSGHLLNNCIYSLSFQELLLQNFHPSDRIHIPTTAQWKDDWVGGNDATSVNTTSDTIMTIAKWAIWRTYCTKVFGKEDTNISTTWNFFINRLIRLHFMLTDNDFKPPKLWKKAFQLLSNNINSVYNNIVI